MDTYGSIVYLIGILYDHTSDSCLMLHVKWGETTTTTSLSMFDYKCSLLRIQQYFTGLLKIDTY